MPVGIGSRTEYQIATAEAWPVPERTKIIVFISTGDNEGTELLSGLAAAIAAGNRKVRVLRADGDSETRDGLEGDIELLQADYLLVDLPFRPTPFARSVLSVCDLVIVAGSCKIDFLSEAENIVKVLLFLGVDPERVAGVLVDPEGILSSASLAEIKPYLESSLDIKMAGVISFGSAPEGQPELDIERLVQYIK